MEYCEGCKNRDLHVDSLKADLIKCQEERDLYLEGMRDTSTEDWVLAQKQITTLKEALKAWDTYLYETGSAKVNGESIYSYKDFQRMRAEAISKMEEALEGEK